MDICLCKNVFFKNEWCRQFLSLALGSLSLLQENEGRIKKGENRYQYGKH